MGSRVKEQGSRSCMTKGGQRAEPGAGQLHGACEPSRTLGSIHCVVGSFWKVLSKGKTCSRGFTKNRCGHRVEMVCRVTTVKAGRPIGGRRSHPGEEQWRLGPVTELSA